MPLNNLEEKRAKAKALGYSDEEIAQFEKTIVSGNVVPGSVKPPESAPKPDVYKADITGRAGMGTQNKAIAAALGLAQGSTFNLAGKIPPVGRAVEKFKSEEPEAYQLGEIGSYMTPGTGPAKAFGLGERAALKLLPRAMLEKGGGLFTQAMKKGTKGAIEGGVGVGLSEGLKDATGDPGERPSLERGAQAALEMLPKGMAGGGVLGGAAGAAAPVLKGAGKAIETQLLTVGKKLKSDKTQKMVENLLERDLGGGVGGVAKGKGALTQSLEKTNARIKEFGEQKSKILEKHADQKADAVIPILQVRDNLMASGVERLGEKNQMLKLVNENIEELSQLHKPNSEGFSLVTAKEMDAIKQRYQDIASDIYEAEKAGRVIDVGEKLKAKTASEIARAYRAKVEEMAPGIGKPNEELSKLYEIKKAVENRRQTAQSNLPFSLIESMAGLATGGAALTKTNPLEALALGAGAAGATKMARSGVTAQKLYNIGKSLEGRGSARELLVKRPALSKLPRNEPMPLPAEYDDEDPTFETALKRRYQ